MALSINYLVYLMDSFLVNTYSVFSNNTFVNLIELFHSGTLQVELHKEKNENLSPSVLVGEGRMGLEDEEGHLKITNPSPHKSLHNHLTHSLKFWGVFLMIIMMALDD